MQKLTAFVIAVCIVTGVWWLLSSAVLSFAYQAWTPVTDDFYGRLLLGVLVVLTARKAMRLILEETDQ